MVGDNHNQQKAKLHPQIVFGGPKPLKPAKPEKKTTILAQDITKFVVAVHIGRSLGSGSTTSRSSIVGIGSSSSPALMRRRVRHSCSIWATWGRERASVALVLTSFHIFWASSYHPPHLRTPPLELTKGQPRSGSLEPAICPAFRGGREQAIG